MINRRAQWNAAAGEPRDAAPHLRAVSPPASPVARPRPRWGQLHLALGAIGVIGGGAHFMVDTPVLVKVVDVAFALALFSVLAGWIHFNRMALTRLDEPENGAVRARIRIVHSGRRPVKEAYEDDRIVRLEPGDRVMLPYDFR
jgi:hypothetical protein